MIGVYAAQNVCNRVMDVSSSREKSFSVKMIICHNVVKGFRAEPPIHNGRHNLDNTGRSEVFGLNTANIQLCVFQFRFDKWPRDVCSEERLAGTNFPWNKPPRKLLSPARVNFSRGIPMNINNRSQSVEFSRRTLAILTSVLLVFVGIAAAKDHKTVKAADKPHVVAHLQFDGMSELDMTIQERQGDRYYLYVQHSKAEGVSIIDIGKPEKPKAIGLLSWADATGEGRMTVTGNLAIVSDRAVALSRSGEVSNDDVALWDTSDPASPRLIQKFSKVVKWLQDDRGFTYVLADDGLWVVVQPKPQQIDAPDSSAYGG